MVRHEHPDAQDQGNGRPGQGRNPNGARFADQGRQHLRRQEPWRLHRVSEKGCAKGYRQRAVLEAESLSVITRLQIFYDSPEGSFYRPFYLYREPQQIEYVHEKEWYYFSRFGCDIPLGVRFSEISTYDRDLDGLPDRELFPFAERITNEYDWDSDGVPDVEDSLPTVHGGCSNRNVRGVPDSDGDGLCDPSYFRFAESAPGMLEGDLAITVMKDADADSCPYVYSRKDGGCP